MLRFTTLILLAFALLAGAGEIHAARIGVASVVKNSVSGSNGGASRVINVGTGIFHNEMITSGAESSAQLLFRDETSMTIGANARVKLDKFVYDPNSKSGDVVVNVLQGTFRFVSGSVKPGGYTIKTPVATVGLRGTIVEGFMSANSLLLVIVEGSVVVTTANGTTVTLNAGQYITVASNGAVTGPSPWTGRTLDIESGHEFILDTEKATEDQRNQFNDAIDSRDVEINFPDVPPRTGKTGGTISSSDAQLKRDIEYLATLENGHRIYAFKYLWEDRVRIGVMAQDLLRDPVFKQAVEVMPNGFYGVNYAELGLKMTTLAEWNEQGIASVKSQAQLAPLKASVSVQPAPGD